MQLPANNSTFAPSIKTLAFNNTNNLTLNINDIIKIQGMLFSQPDKAWLEIKQNQYSWKQVFTYYLIPLLFISSLASAFFMGRQFEELGFDWNQIFLITFVGSLIAIYISGHLITALAPRFTGSGTFDESISLIAFAYSPVFLASVIASVHETLQIINLIAIIYMLYIFFKGIPGMMNIPVHKQLGFTIISVMILFLSRLMISAFFAAIMAVINA